VHPKSEISGLGRPAARRLAIVWTAQL